MAAAAILDRMAISPQRLTIYLYSAHRAVIFAIAQLSSVSCILLLEQTVRAEYVVFIVFTCSWEECMVFHGRFQ